MAVLNPVQFSCIFSILDAKKNLHRLAIRIYILQFQYRFTFTLIEIFLN